MHPLLSAAGISEEPGIYLASLGEVFAVFDEHTQDSGNISYGVDIEGERFFVKSAGRPETIHPFLSRADRVGLLKNAARLASECDHPALPGLRHVIEHSPHGPLLVYEWAKGELLGVPNPMRENPRSSFQRFRSLPADEIIQALTTIYQAHAALAALGWVAADFYDGSLIYDFSKRRIRLVDLDYYHKGPFTNMMGVMFGSSRFMAPEELTLGAAIDQRTTVFTMGRTASVFLSDGALDREPFRGSDTLYEVMLRACRPERAERFCTMQEFYSTWNNALRNAL